MKTAIILALISLPLAAQQRVSDRVSLAAAALAPGTDILPVVDISAGLSGSKKITINDVFTGWGFSAAGAVLAKAADAPAQRTALGLGTAATLNHGTAAGNLVRLDPATGKLPAVDGSLLTGLPASGEPVLGNPAADNYLLSSTSAGIRSWIAAPVSGEPALPGPPAFNGYVLSTSNTGVRSWVSNGEPVLGNPGTNGYILSSTTGGTRSWIAPPTGGGDVLKANNLSEFNAPATALLVRANLGLVIGTNVHPYSSTLASWDNETPPGGTVVGTDDTQTLSNKTLNSPKIQFSGSATGDIYYNNTATDTARRGIGSAGQVLKVVSGVPSWSTDSFENFSSSISIAAPNATVPVVQITPTNVGYATIDLALLPAGSSSAILADVPDNLVTGGNKRGSQAVDFQMTRTANTQVASGANSVIIGGTSGTASGANSAVLGGSSSTADGSHSFATGSQATARGLAYAQPFGAGMFAAQGDAQAVKYLLRAATATATITELSLGGGGATATTRVVLPTNSTYSFRGLASARSSTGDSKAWRFDGTIERGATAADTAIVGTVTSTSNEEAGAAAWVLTISADATNGTLRFQGTGEAATNIRWLVSLQTCELVY